MGKLDNTLIIYINGDNGTSAEGDFDGTPNEVAMFNGVNPPVELQLKEFYDKWAPTRLHHMSIGWAWLRHAVCLDETNRFEVRRHETGHGDLVAEGDHGQGRTPPPISSRDRHRADPAGAAGIKEPEEVDGVEQSPMEG